MLLLQTILGKNPSEVFIGVVELDDSLLVGVLDDPIGVDLAAVRLGYPLELIQKWDGQQVQQKIFVPETGVPDETVVDAASVSIVSGASDFGQTYLTNLKKVIGIKATYQSSFAPKPCRV